MTTQTLYWVWQILVCYSARVINPIPGENAFEDPAHIYTRDLNVFGDGSLRTALHGPHLDWPRRQDAVKELHPRTDLREQLALHGDHDFSCSETRSRDLEQSRRQWTATFLPDLYWMSGPWRGKLAVSGMMRHPVGDEQESTPVVSLLGSILPACADLIA